MDNRIKKSGNKWASRLKALFLYCGLTCDQYRAVREQIHQKNEKVVYVASAATVILGAVLFAVNSLSSSLAIYPCLIMIASGVLIFATRFIPNKTHGFITFLCYALLVLLLAAAAATSFLPSNRSIPATTFVAFLALIPLLIEDAPVKMMPVVAVSGGAYIGLARVYKESSAFGLDVTNTVTFLIIGLFLYTVMMRRTASEIWQTMRVKAIQNDVITALGTVIEARDGITGEHVAHTQDLVDLLVAEMKKRKKYAALPEWFFDNVCRAAALHDVGKMQIPDSILSKPGRLTSEEFEIMKKHTTSGAEIISKTAKNSSDKQFFDIAYNIVKYHHERYDGKGYPSGLAGEEIPLEARIMALADVYDALISPRPYKDALPKEQAVKIIEEGRGGQFDPELTSIFVEIIKQ